MNNVSHRRILLTTTAAFLLAVVLLTTLVLPAEYGWDPLGSGEALGLTEMSRIEINPLTPQPQPWQTDSIEFQLAPFEAVEYKYRLSAGATLLFSWRATAEVKVDMHAEPDGAAPGYAESFDITRSNSGAGGYTAPFKGIHGWFWQNRGRENVTLTLQTSGFYTQSLEMRDGRITTRAFGTDAAPTTQP